ncbi:MAG: monovalent cation/H+ antiporter complex subunit F [Gammaproteobacteria bacterium]
MFDLATGEVIQGLTGMELIAMIFMVLALFLTLARLLAGPGAADRIVAADTLSILVTTAIVGLAALLESGLYLDVALLYVTLAFVGIVALARAMDAQTDARDESASREERP